MKKRIFSILLAAVLPVLSLAGCGQTNTTSYHASDYPKELTIDVFDSIANYQGIQSGWFAKVVEDRFNMKLNIIAPNASYNGEVMQDVRAASGDLGDIVICSAENGALSQMTEAGLLLDMSDYIEGKNIEKRYGSSISSLNSGLDGIYAIPNTMSTLASTEPQNIEEPTYSPYLRWDLYAELGYPKIETLEDLLPVLKKMQDLEPTSESGDPVYAFSLFADWDDNMMNAAKQPCCFYGFDEAGFVLDSADGTEYQNILDEDSLYMRALKFYFEANQMGLVDPESRTQTYSDVFDKYKDGAVLFSTWPYQGQSAYNTEKHLSEGKGFYAADIEDMQIYADGCPKNGNTKTVIAVGSNAEDPQRMVDFIDWLYSDEGVYNNQAASSDGSAGPKGILWNDAQDGPALTDLGVAAFLNKESVELPGYEDLGSYQEGVSQLNFSAVNLKETDKNGIPYSYRMWESEENRAKSSVEEDWSSHMENAADTIDYLDKTGKLDVAPGVSFIASEEDSEIKEIRDACKAVIVEYSWDMVFAKNEEKFNKLQKEMIDTCEGLSYDTVYEFDLTNAKEMGTLRQNELKQ